jgi:hypothetical protein
MSHLPPEKIEALAVSKAVDPHLSGCAECRKAVGSARARRTLLKGMKDVTLTEAAFRRVEARLASEAVKPVSAWGLVFAQLRSNWMLFGAVVALALIVLVPRLLEEKTPVIVAQAPVKVPAGLREPDTTQWTAMIVEGVVHRNGSALAAGDVVKPADVLDARMGRLVLAGLGRDARLELLGVAKLGGGATVSLEEGTLAIEAAPEVLVEAAGAWVLGSDAAFVVSRAAAEVVIEVLEGKVRVGSDSALRDSVTLSAPRRLKLPLPVKPPFALGDDQPTPYPFAKVPKQPWARFDVGDLPAGSTFDVEGHHGGTPTSMMLTDGRHRVRVQVPGQGSRETWVQLVSGSDTHLKLPPRGIGQQKDEPPPSEDAIADLQRAIKDQRPKLRACYEKWLKANPVATGAVTLTLVVSKSGKVVGARVDDATIPRESVDCLVRTGKRLVLPPLGSEQEIEVPLSFTQGGSR